MIECYVMIWRSVHFTVIPQIVSAIENFFPWLASTAKLSLWKKNEICGNCVFEFSTICKIQKRIISVETIYGNMVVCFQN